MHDILYYIHTQENEFYILSDTHTERDKNNSGNRM